MTPCTTCGSEPPGASGSAADCAEGSFAPALRPPLPGAASGRTHVDVDDARLAAQVGEHVILGQAFAFIRRSAFATPGLAWLAPVAGTLGDLVVPLVTGGRVALPGATLDGSTLAPLSLRAIGCDRPHYRAGHDRVELLVVDALAPSRRAQIALAFAGAPVARHTVELGAGGAGTLSLGPLPAGSYAVHFVDTRTADVQAAPERDRSSSGEPACAFAVLEPGAAPVAPVLESRAAHGAGSSECASRTALLRVTMTRLPPRSASELDPVTPLAGRLAPRAILSAATELRGVRALVFDPAPKVVVDLGDLSPGANVELELDSRAAILAFGAWLSDGTPWEDWAGCIAPSELTASLTAEPTGVTGSGEVAHLTLATNARDEAVAYVVVKDARLASRATPASRLDGALRSWLESAAAVLSCSCPTETLAALVARVRPAAHPSHAIPPGAADAPVGSRFADGRVDPPALVTAAATSARGPISPDELPPSELAPCASDDPTTLFAGVLAVRDGRATLEVALGDRPASYVAEAFVLDGSDWIAAETHFRSSPRDEPHA